MDLIARLNRALAGRYRVERPLGEGGMATVYLPVLEGRSDDHRDYVLSGLKDWRLAWDGRYKRRLALPEVLREQAERVKTSRDAASG